MYVDYCITCVVQCIHSTRGIIHADLKPLNVVLSHKDLTKNKDYCIDHGGLELVCSIIILILHDNF